MRAHASIIIHRCIGPCIGAVDKQEYAEVIDQGKLIGRDNFLMAGTQDDEPNKILTAFVKQFYDATPYVPPRILLQHPLEEADSIVKWLREKRKGNGTNAVGSMVVFEDAKPKKAHYRRFQIKSVKGVDDYSMMREMLTRRFKRLSQSRKPRELDALEGDVESAAVSNGNASSKNAWGIEPDLVLIDGGKGHLGAALQVFLELGINDIPLASLAKENEELSSR
ncbi:UvrABC system protein C [Geodia barretti]|uniref:UvrABC system protein C n=1 Tax=Geodia barretti TaxID=519541 RepID=A0AA35QV78_GEOBA|nr:UvrABC system protein C [Geodia barretti]